MPKSPSNSSVKPLIFVVRHGETELNAEDCFRGKVNVDLDKKGIEQAHTVGKKFSTLEFSDALSSDRRRAVDTMEIIAEHNEDIQYSITPKLRAWDVGFLSGKPKNEENIKKLQKYIDNPDIPIPEGESLNHFKSRVRPVIRESLRTASLEGKPVLIVGHSSIVHELGSMFHGDTKAVLVEPGGIALVFRGPDNKVSAKALFRPKEPEGSDTVS